MPLDEISSIPPVVWCLDPFPVSCYRCAVNPHPSSLLHSIRDSGSNVNALSLSLQRVVCPVEANLSGLLWNRSISPNSLLETTISEEVRPRDFEEEEASVAAASTPPTNTASRRHTLAEVSARFHQCNPPCECQDKHSYTACLSHCFVMIAYVCMTEHKLMGLSYLQVSLSTLLREPTQTAASSTPPTLILPSPSPLRACPRC